MIIRLRAQYIMREIVEVIPLGNPTSVIKEDGNQFICVRKNLTT